MAEPVETAGNETVTGCQLQDDMPLWAAHLDEQMHRITRFIDQWEPLLARYGNGAGAAVMSYLKGARRG